MIIDFFFFLNSICIHQEKAARENSEMVNMTNSTFLPLLSVLLILKSHLHFSCESYGMLNILSKILEGPSYVYALLSQNKLVHWPCEQMPGNEVIELSNIFRKLLYGVINVLIRFLFSSLTCSGGSTWES